jgi:UPF0176 protein
MPPVVNIAAYQFTPLADLPALRADLRSRATALQIKGTILLAPEGINLFLAGSRPSIDSFLHHLRTLPGLANLAVKESLSDAVPFTRLMVRLKKEIITFRQPQIDPLATPAPRISPQELKHWLDESRPVVLLDTRNTYETDLGTFDGALTLPLKDFTHFPDQLHHLPADKNTPIVTFCTGGIRCEKAAPFLQSRGYQNVYQLEGGILNYFEKAGSAHYTGACFVFDHRTAVTPSLKPISPPCP